MSKPNQVSHKESCLSLVRSSEFVRNSGPYSKYNNAEHHSHAARTLLAQFHHVCRDSTPFSIDVNLRQSLKSALLDDDTIIYLLTVREQVEKKGS